MEKSHRLYDWICRGDSCESCAGRMGRRLPIDRGRICIYLCGILWNEFRHTETDFPQRIPDDPDSISAIIWWRNSGVDWICGRRACDRFPCAVYAFACIPCAFDNDFILHMDDASEIQSGWQGDGIRIQHSGIRSGVISNSSRGTDWFCQNSGGARACQHWNRHCKSGEAGSCKRKIVAVQYTQQSHTQRGKAYEHD